MESLMMLLGLGLLLALGFSLIGVPLLMRKVNRLEQQLWDVQHQLAQRSQSQQQPTSSATTAAASVSTAEQPASAASTVSPASDSIRPSQSPAKEFTAQADTHNTSAQPSPWGRQAPAETQRAASTESLQQLAAQAPSSLFDKLLALGKGHFTQDNWPVLTGIIVLFFGVSYLIKYAADNNLLPIELRLLGVMLLGAVLIGVGWRMRHRDSHYSTLLQGGGFGLLFITLFATYRFYGLLPASVTFAAMLGVVLFASFLAVRQNSLILAVLGSLGGYLAPLLASSDSGNHIGLFSYYEVLNLGLLAMAWFKAWRLLNLIGFVFCFTLLGMWMAHGYSPADQLSTGVFVALYFLHYAVLSLLYGLRRAPRFRDYLDATLLFGTPTVCAGLNYLLLNDLDYGLPLATLAMASVYALMAFWLHARQQLPLLQDTYAALTLMLATLAIAYAASDFWTGAIYALEGAGCVWISHRTQRPLLGYWGILVQLISGYYFADASLYQSPTSLLDPTLLGHVLLVAAALLSMGWLPHQTQAMSALGKRLLQLPAIDSISQLLRYALAVWSLGWWLHFGCEAVPLIFNNGTEGSPYDYRWQPGWMAFWTLSLLITSVLHSITRWSLLTAAPAIWLGLGSATLVCQMAEYQHLGFAAGQGWSWLWLGAFYLALWWHDQPLFADQPPRGADALHAWLGLLWTAAVSQEIYWQASHRLGSADWGLCLALLPWMIALLKMTYYHGWPFARHQRGYGWLLQASALVLVAGSLLTLILPGDLPPWPSIPLLNPLDLLLMAAAAVLCLARSQLQLERLSVGGWLVVGLIGLAQLSAIGLRTLHHWLDVPYTLWGLFASSAAQAWLSILWCFCGLALAIVGNRKLASRPVWYAGAGLLVVVLAKLYLVDLHGTGTLARVVSFIGVGLLLVVVGYWFPVPKQTSSQAQQDAPLP